MNSSILLWLHFTIDRSQVFVTINYQNHRFIQWLRDQDIRVQPIVFHSETPSADCEQYQAYLNGLAQAYWLKDRPTVCEQEAKKLQFVHHVIQTMPIK